MAFGDKINAALKDMADRLSSASTVQVGFMEGATYPDGTPVALVTAINEFGAPSRGQPPRPFFRTMIAQHSGEWPDQLQDLLVKNDLDASKALNLLGEGIKGQLQESITSLISPPLAPSTIEKKGSAKPLIDSGHMLASITSKVE